MVTMPAMPPAVAPGYQLPAVVIARAEFDALPFRDDDEAGTHVEGGAYRTREGYPSDLFFWVINDNGDGEWRRAPAAITG